jgi:hypothetical protein
MVTSLEERQDKGDELNYTQCSTVAKTICHNLFARHYLASGHFEGVGGQERRDFGWGCAFKMRSVYISRALNLTSALFRITTRFALDKCWKKSLFAEWFIA